MRKTQAEQTATLQVTVTWWLPGHLLLNKMRIMCSEVGLGDEDVEKVWSSFTVLMTLN